MEFYNTPVFGSHYQKTVTLNSMASASRDQNSVTTMLGVSSADGVTVVPIEIDSVTGRLLLLVDSMGAHSAVTNRQIAFRDQNSVPTMMAESENDDGVLANVVVDAGVLRVKGS